MAKSVEPACGGKAALAGALLAGLLAFGLYLPSLKSEFVYDARAQIQEDSYIHVPAHGWNIVSLGVLSEDVLDRNRPVHLLSLWTDSMLWGKRPFGYHLTSNLLHASTVMLLFLLLSKLGRNERGATARLAWCAAFMGALWFAVHPVHVETVAEVSYREDLLATLLLLAGLYAATIFAVQQGAARVAAAALCVVCILGAAGSKETGFAGPFLLACYAGLYHRHDNFRPWAILLAVSFVTVGIFGAAQFLLRPEASEIFTDKPGYPGGSLAAALQIQPRLWTFLWGQLAWPGNLSANYLPSHIAGISPAAGWAVLTIVLGAQIALSLKSRMACLGTAVFWLGFAPVSNFVPLFRPLADRFLYLPGAGTAFLLAAIVLLAGRRQAVLVVLAAAWAVMISVLTWQTCRRQPVFSSDLSLWEDTVQKSPDSAEAFSNRGYAHYEVGAYSAAHQDLQQALILTQGRQPQVWGGLALVFERTGDPHRAEEALQNAIRIDPRYERPAEAFPRVLMDARHADAFEQIARRLRSQRDAGD